MTDLLKKFSAAAKEVSSHRKSMVESVYCAYINHLKDINADDLPEEIQIIYESVIMRLTSVEPPGDIGNDEADYLTKDIIYMTEVIREHYKKTEYNMRITNN